MKEIKLEVIRINEDVIATSGLCKVHPNANHLYTYNNTGSIMKVDFYLSGSLTKGDSFENNYNAFNPNLNNSTAPGKWYYQEGEKFVECTGNHDDYVKADH